MTDKIIDAIVSGDRPLFNNGVLHAPGEPTKLNLTALGVKSIDDPAMPGVEDLPKDFEMATVAAAPVAPHVPDPTAPQGIPPGTVQSGTGKLLAPAGEDGSTATVAEVKAADGADAAGGDKAKK